jgi:hypothetical protein
VFGNSTALTLRTVDDAAAGFTVSDTDLNVAGAKSIAVVSGDIDGAGTAEILIAVATAEMVTVRPFESGSLGSPIYSTALAMDGASARVYLHTSALDYDDGRKIGIVVNEIDLNSSTATSVYTILDDASASFATLKTGSLSVEDAPTNETVEVRVGNLAFGNLAFGNLAFGNLAFGNLAFGNLAFGNFDVDDLDEVAFGGVQQVHSLGGSVRVAAQVFDDATTDFAPFTARVFDAQLGNSSRDPAHVDHVFVAAPDVDGDGDNELLLMRHVFDNVAHNRAWDQLGAFSLPVLSDFDDTAGFAIGDFTSAGKDNIIIADQQLDSLLVFGSVNGTSMSTIKTLELESFGGEPDLLMIPVDLDNDSVLVEHMETTTSLVFTEPIVLAVLAAPPCVMSIDQNLDDCSTNYGSAESAGQENTHSVSVSAGAQFCVSSDGGGLIPVSTETELQFTATATGTLSNSATVTTSVSFVGGGQEDAVVFTTVPYDKFTYRVLASPGGAGNDTIMHVLVPRDPITLIAERSFYNQNTPVGSLKIDASVLGHTIGQVDSYPSTTERDEILDTTGTGLESAEFGVGQGTCQTEVQVAVAEGFGTGGSMAFDFEVQLKASLFGIMGGVSVGVGTEHGINVTSGTETIFGGSIGSIGADFYTENAFNSGLFSYVHTGNNGQQFHVIN